MGKPSDNAQQDFIGAGVLGMEAGVQGGPVDSSRPGRTLLAGFLLPLPPSANVYWRHRAIRTRDGGLAAVTYVSEEAKAYQERVKEILLESQYWHRSTVRIAYRAAICPKSSREQDISNRIKVLEDALQYGNLFNNDSQVDQIEIRRGPVVAGGAVKLSVWEVLPDYVANLRWAEGVG